MVFYATGAAGFVFGVYWLIVYRDPKELRDHLQKRLGRIRTCW
jgi:hypothetical protein